MHPVLADVIKGKQHQINPRIANGFSTERMLRLEQHIHELFRITYPKFGCDFKLDDISLARPEEHFAEVTRSRNNKKRHFEINRSDYYMVRLHCSLDGHPLEPTNLLIPRSKGYNLLKIRGSMVNVRPVMADTAVSVMRNSLFVQVSCAPLTFMRLDYSVLVNNEARTNQVIYGKQLHSIHGKSTNGKTRVIKANLALVHYVLSTHGFDKAVKMFTSADVRFGVFDSSALDREEWTVYESLYTKVQGRPSGHAFTDEMYEAHKFKIAIRTADVTPLFESLVYSTFYIIDIFPNEVMEAETEDFNNPEWWRILLGHIIHSTKLTTPNNIRKMTDHMESISSFLDDVTKFELDRNNIRVNDIIELFVWVCENYNDKLKDYRAGFDFNGKRLMVERYLTDDLQKQINGLAWKIRKAVDSRSGLNAKEASDLLSRNIRSEVLMRLTSNHGEVESVQCPTNNPIPKITSMICPQVSAGSKGRHGEINRDDPAYRLTWQLVVNCSVRDLSKSVPTGHNKINLFADLTEEGEIRISADLDQYIARMESVFN